MAVKGTEKELLTNGMEIDAQSKGAYIQNMDRHLNWKVRKGFGQLQQFDSTFGLDDVEIIRHLGSHYIKTDFTHGQILSVICARVNTGNFIQTTSRTSMSTSTWEAAGPNGMYLDCYLLSIYDLDTNELYEELIHSKTDDLQIRPFSLQHALYESNKDRNYEDYIQAINDRQFFFEEIQDVVYFGDVRLGCWAYIPTSIRKLRSRQVHNECGFDWTGWDGESSFIRRMSPRDGDFAASHVYLKEAEFPRPNDITNIDGRVVYADGTTLWFSDVGDPGAILADNYVIVPSENPITAIQELAGNIIIFTQSEMYFYRPSVGGLLLSGGQLQRVSTDIGCINARSVVKSQGSLLWVDDRGIYSSNNGLSINKLSKGIEKLWTEFISNPLTQFYQASGIIDTADMANANPSIIHKFKSQDVHIVYDHIRQSIVCSVPTQDFAMVLNSDGWSVWNFESIAASNGTIKATKNIKNPHFVMGEDALYLVGSIETYTIDDDSKLTQDSPDVEMKEDWRTDSFYILEYGRGGALDRGVQWRTEDKRLINGKYYKMSSDTAPYIPNDANENVVLVDEWNRVDVGYQLNNTIVPASSPTSTDFVTTSGDVFLLPFSIVPAEPYNWGGTFPKLPNKLIVQFFFDDNLWEPVFIGDTDTTLAMSFPAERVTGAGGWTAVCRSGAGGALSRSGNFIDIQYDSAGSANPWGYLVLNQYNRNRLFYIAMKAKHSSLQASTSMGLEGYRMELINDIDTGNTYTTQAHFYPWQGSFIDNKLSETGRHGAAAAGTQPTNNIAQPVDWVFKTAQVGLENGAQSKARSLYIRMKSRGKGEATIIDNPQFGLLNGILASDWKDWSSQFIDYQGTATETDDPPVAAGTTVNLNKDIKNIEDKTSIRTRMYDSSTNSLKDRTFNNAAKWSKADNSTTGNYLIDDQEYDTIAMSTSVKGEFFSWLLFGHMNNAAESLEVDSVKATLRPAGGRRRKGR